MPMVLAAVLRFFPPSLAASAGFVNRPALREAARNATLPPGLADKFKLTLPDAIKYVYATGIGPGAAVLPQSATLANAEGAPLELTMPKGAAGGAPKVLLAALAIAAVGVALRLRK